MIENKTLNQVLFNRIQEEDCSPLKDKTTFNTPTELISNNEGKTDSFMKNASDNTIQTINQNLVQVKS